MRISELIIEVTRRCNVNCEHCLRGEPQNVDISDSTIYALLKDVDSIDCVTFSGGEPSLASNKIKCFTKAVKELGIEVYSFYVATNGKIASMALVEALIELYAYCENKGEDFYGGLCISGDQFHADEIDSTAESKNLYSALSFFRPDERQKDLESDRIIDEGRAHDNGYGSREAPRDPISFGIETIDSTIYVNALGDVCTCCNLSYESQDEEKIGSVHEETIADMVLKHVEVEV